MDKFRRFLGRISVETCLKMDCFDNISQKSPSAGGSQTPLPPADRARPRALPSV